MNYKTPFPSPNLDYLYKTPTPPQYPDGEAPYDLLKNQSEYLKNTLPALEEMAKNSKSQAESSMRIAESSKLQADTAYKVSKKADVKGWLALILSACSVFIEFSIHHAEVFDFIKTFFR